MSKGNSGILSKHQAKIEYSSEGVVGPEKGFEVLKEVVVRVRIKGAKPNSKVRVKARTANDDSWENIGIIEGAGSLLLHIASWDYIQFECEKYSSVSSGNTLISSGFFSDGMFAVNAINDMSDTLANTMIKLTSEVCDIKQQLNTLHRQIEIITDHEEDEVK